MNDEVFIDASGWVAVFWPRDKNFDTAREVWQALIDQDWLLVTTNWTLYEALTMLSGHCKRHDLAMRLLDAAKDNSEIISIDLQTEESALDMFRRFQDKTWSVVDCANFEIIRSRSCAQVFAFDGDFAQASGIIGFRMLL